MDDANDPPAAHEVDGMDVSPALHPDPADDKENDAEIDAPHLAPSSADLRDTKFTFILHRYNTIHENKVHSPWHHFGGFRWRLLIFPRGNHTSDHDLSVYLECGGPVPPDHSTNGRETVHIPPTPWRRPAKFSLHVVHPLSPTARTAMRADPYPAQSGLADLDVTDSNLIPPQHIPSDIMKETMHTFRDNASDWGFLEFASFGNLQPGQYADDEMNVVIMVKIRLEDNLPDLMLTNTNTWDSRKQTGFVGFKNQGATCYMNSLLQTLYTLSAFRQAVYNMPLPEPGNDMSGSELSYAMQKVFYELQFSETVVKTKRLTESFGWDTTEAFTQHDVQELKLILCDELAERMKKVAPNKPNILTTLFQGKILNYIECVNVEYKSTREEDFSDLSLDVKRCRNIYDSFDRYVEVEMLSGDNKYKADGHEELQEARKGVKFLRLPPVLHIHLKRFDFDPQRLTMIKINDRYEFDTEIDLSQYVENSDGSDVYVLHSVLVHIGDVNGGHYHAYIRPEVDIKDGEPKKPSQWFKFDDETVSLATEEAAIQDNFGFGGENNLQKRGPGIDDALNGIHDQTPTVFQTRSRHYQNRRHSNAYMLQYLRKAELPYLLKKASKADVPADLVAQIEKERKEEEQRRRDRLEQHLYMRIAVVTNDNMAKHHGSDLVDWETVRIIKVKRAMQLLELKALLQRDGIVSDPKRMRLWKCSGRRNETMRPDSLVASGIDTQPITDANGRLPLNQSGYAIPLHYTGRHGYHGIHDDVVRMYAEELASIFCLDPGLVYKEREDKEADVNGEAPESHSMPDGKIRGEMDMDRSPQTAPFSPPYPLKAGMEVLLFLKFYTATPVPRLQWLGHFVVDREMKVRELHPMMRAALTNYARGDPTLQVIDEDAPIVVYEEVSYGNIPRLDPDRSLQSQRIPLESGCGDILIFQQAPEMPSASASYGGDRLVSDVWDHTQEMSRGDGTDRPLGGRPLPDVKLYFDYLAYRIKIEFKDKHTYGGPDEAKSIFFELLRRDSYKTARAVLAHGLGVNPDYLRFFGHDINREAPMQSAIRIKDSEPLERVLPMHSLMATGQQDHRILWYERTEYHIREFDHKDEVKVVWRQDGGARATPYTTAKGVTTTGNGGSVDATPVVTSKEDVAVKMDGSNDGEVKKESEKGDEKEGNRKSSKQMSVANNGDGSSRSFSVLVPVMSTYEAVQAQVRLKLGIPQSVGIRMFEVKNSKIFKFIHSEDTIPPIMTALHDCGAELRAEPVPEEETEEALGEDYELMSVLHLSKEKQPRVWRELFFFGVPFVIKVKRGGETIRSIRERIQEKLGVPSEQFDEWPLAEIKHLKVAYLDQPDAIYTPQSRRSVEFCSLAIEHKWTVPARRMTSAMSRYADKPLRIRS